MISHQTCQYEPVEIDLYQLTVTIPPLKTREEMTSAAPQVWTPKFLYPDPATHQKSPNVRMGQKSTGTYPVPRSPAVTIPSTVKTNSPLTLGSKRAPRMQTNLAQRRLEDDLVASIPNQVEVLLKDKDITQLQSFDPITATINTTEGRATASDAF